MHYARAMHVQFATSQRGVADHLECLITMIVVKFAIVNKLVLMATQTRDKILKEGSIRYRQSTISLQKVRGC